MKRTMRLFLSGMGLIVGPWLAQFAPMNHWVQAGSGVVMLVTLAVFWGQVRRAREREEYLRACLRIEHEAKLRMREEQALVDELAKEYVTVFSHVPTPRDPEPETVPAL